jgi:Ca2+-binding RTX toxin-like protein
MTSINTHYKANMVDAAAQGATTDPYLDQVKADLEEALAEIEQFKEENAQWLDSMTEEQWLTLNRLEVTSKATIAAIDAGTYRSTSAPAAVDENGNLLNQPQELQDGWNGVDGYVDPDDAYGQDLVDDDPDKYGEFGGTVNIPNSGNAAAPTSVGFQMTDDMVGITAESRGRDIIVTVEYEDGTKKSWVVKEGTVRPEPIIISARGLTHGVTMDFSRVMRASTGEYPGYPYGQRSGFYIHGTDYKDTIIGTQSDDAIVAYAGNDTIDAMAGNDTVYGDEYYQTSGDQTMGYGGDDTIKGGAGDDILYGGGGLDTSFKSDKGEAVAETEGWVNDVTDAANIPPSDDWFDSPGDDWVVTDEVEDGMVVIENQSGEAGSMTLTMPDGYNMAYAEMDGDGNLVITFVGDEGTFKVMIEDFFSKFQNDDVVRLVFEGGSENDIIDFSRVEITNQTISIYGEGGDDLIMGAENALLSDGVDMENLLESQRNSNGELEGYVEEGIFASDDYADGDNTSADGYHSEAKDGYIEITADPNDPDGPAEKLNINAPDGYDHGYITTDAAGNTYVILVKQTESGKAETIVIKVNSSLCGPGGLSYDDIKIKHGVVDDDETTWGNPLELTWISSDIEDYLLDGGGGNDIVFTQKGGYTDGAEDVVEVEPEPVVEYTPTSSSTDSSSSTVDEEEEVVDDDTTTDPDDEEASS